MNAANLREASGIFGAVEAFLTFVVVLVYALMPNYQISATLVLCAVLIIGSGSLLCINGLD